MVLRKNRVIGGITYRLFEDRNFVEKIRSVIINRDLEHA